MGRAGVRVRIPQQLLASVSKEITMSTLPDQRPESLGGYIVHNIPFPRVLNDETLALLKQMTPIQIEQIYSIAYLHSYGQDSPFFAGLTNSVLLGSRDPRQAMSTSIRAATT